MKIFAKLLLSLSLILFSAITPALAAPSAVISIVPATGTMTVGNNFTVDLRINTGGQAVGTISLDLNYSANLQYVSFDGAGSNFTGVFEDPAPANNHFTLVRYNTTGGFNGTGQIIKLTFKPTAAGTGTVSINKSASAAYDATGDNDILQSVSNASYTLANPVVVIQPSPTPSPSAASPSPSPTPAAASSPNSDPSPPSTTVSAESPASTAASAGTTTNNTTTATATNTTKTTATTSTKTSTTTSTSGKPNASTSTVVTSKICVVADGKSQSSLKVTVRDKNDKVLTGINFKPKVSLSPNNTAKVTVVAIANGWGIHITDTKAEKVTASISSAGVKLGSRTVTFQSGCGAAAAVLSPDQSKAGSANSTVAADVPAAAKQLPRSAVDESNDSQNTQLGIRRDVKIAIISGILIVLILLTATILTRRNQSTI